MNKLQVCLRCKKEKPLIDFYPSQLKTWPRCKECFKDYRKNEGSEKRKYWNREWYKKNKKRALKYARDWRLKNRESYRKWQKEYGIKNKRNRKDYQLKRNYGISLIFYEKILEIQKNKCAVCGSKDDSKFSLDHCHETKLIRGILCRKCNSALGLLQDNSVLARRLADYLDKSYSENIMDIVNS